MIEVPNYGSLRGSEREIVILRSDNGETWREHTVEVTDEVVKDILGANFDKEGILISHHTSREILSKFVFEAVFNVFGSKITSTVYSFSASILNTLPKKVRDIDAST